MHDDKLSELDDVQARVNDVDDEQSWPSEGVEGETRKPQEVHKPGSYQGPGPCEHGVTLSAYRRPTRPFR